MLCSGTAVASICAGNLVAEVGPGKEASWFLWGTSEAVVQHDRENKRLDRRVMSQP